MHSISDQEMTHAFRRRIQAQALCHLVGQSVPGHVIQRFRKAGTWNLELDAIVPSDLMAILADSTHPRRLASAEGPLIGVTGSAGAEIIDVKEHLLSMDVNLRRVAAAHFFKAVTDNPAWMSAYTAQILHESQTDLESSDDKTWIGVGLKLFEAISSDFHVNCAGVKQSLELQYNEGYQEFFGMVFRPPAKCFEHDRPPIWNPVTEANLIRQRIEELSSRHNLADALSSYLRFCGYLPLTGDLSSSAMIDAWTQKHSEKGIWRQLWEWRESMTTAIADYHVASALLENPRWIQVEEIDRLLTLTQGIIGCVDSTCDYEQSPLWRLRAVLLQHYQQHIEAWAPGLDSDIVATSACWLVEELAKLLHTDLDHVAKSIKTLQETQLQLSSTRWTIARSRMPPSALRCASLFSPFIWSDSLLATGIKQWRSFPACDAREQYHEFLAQRMHARICEGSLQTIERGQTTYAFEVAVAPADLEIQSEGTISETFDACRQVFAARVVIDGSDGIDQLLQELTETPEGIADFIIINLQSQIFIRGSVAAAIEALLSNDEWRRCVFERLPLQSLETLLFFLTEWQLQQDGDWNVRVPHLLAYECERIEDQERRGLLLIATIMSSMAADIASPVERLLRTRRDEAIKILTNWRETVQQIAHDSEPWVAARIRGFLGSIDSKQ